MSDPVPPSSDEIVRYEVAGGVARVTLNRPAALNALDLAVISRLREVFVSAAAAAEVRALVLTGAGRAFSAGGDVKAMLSIEGTTSPQAAMLDAVGELHEMLASLYRLPKPVVAAVNGPAAGAGVGLALACDVAWASSAATFTLAFTGIGVSPDSGTTYLLPRAVGPRRAAELFFTNRRLAAEEALAAGLVTRVLDDGDLLPAAEKLAARLAHGPTLAYARVKKLLRRSGTADFDTQLERERREVGRSAATADFAEGLRAFVDKRRPEFRGE